jgi:hypothetical protein
LNQFKENGKLGYWWLHANGTLQYNTNCHGVNPNDFFNTWVCVGWWKVECELDWYRMMKESDILREGPLENLTA